MRLRTTKQIVGQQGEDDALNYLRRHGLVLIERNFRCKGGEIDLLMKDKHMLVFVEVRKRADKKYGGAAASVTAAKQQRLIAAAQHYLQRYTTLPPCRFDVIAIDGHDIAWLKNAIDA